MGSDNLSFPEHETTDYRIIDSGAALSDLFNRRIIIAEDRPPISEGVRQMDIRENMKRFKAMTINYSNRGQWRNKAAGSAPKS